MLILFLSGWFLILSINQKPEFVLSTILIMIYGFEYLIQNNKHKKIEKTIMIILFVYLVGNPVIKNYAALGYQIFRNSIYKYVYYEEIEKKFYVKSYNLRSTIFNQESLSRLLKHRNQVNTDVKKINEVIDLLKNDVDKNDHIMTVDMTNIFSFALNLKSPRNDLLYWHYGITFSKESLREFDVFKQERLFKDVTIIVLPNIPIQNGTKGIFLDYFKAYLRTNYYQHMVTENWTIMKKINR